MIVSTRESSYKLKKKAASFFANILRYLFLLAFSYVLLYPLLYIFVNSFKNPVDYFNPSVQWVLKRFSLVNFDMAYKALDFGSAIKSTFLNEMVSTVIQVVACSVAAFGLAKFDFKGKKFLLASMFVSILVPSIMTIVPTYVNFKNFGILGTPLVFWLPSLTCVGLNCGLYIYIFTQFFKSFPKEIEEAAWIDGAGTWKTFLKIVVPSSKVSFVTVSVFSIVWNWNDYYLPQMFLTDNYPLSVKLNNLPENIGGWLGQFYGSNAKLSIALVLIAACLLCIAPLLIFYIIIQRKFIASVVNSGIVG